MGRKPKKFSDLGEGGVVPYIVPDKKEVVKILNFLDEASLAMASGDRQVTYDACVALLGQMVWQAVALGSPRMNERADYRKRRLEQFKELKQCHSLIIQSLRLMREYLKDIMDNDKVEKLEEALKLLEEAKESGANAE